MMPTGTPRVVIADPLSQHAVDLMARRLTVIEATDLEGLHREIEDASALVVRSRTRVSAGLLDRGERLRLVARAGIGVDNVDVDAATARGILVINAPLGNVRSTAEHTIALIFALARRLPQVDRSVRDGAWKTGYEGMQLAGKRLGIIGMGRIGRQVASLAAAIGMEVVSFDPYLPDELRSALPYRSVAFDALLATSDVVTLHVPLTPETQNVLGAKELRAMRQGALLINCARGGLVDEAALVEALQSGHLGGAALDVFATEPLREGPLFSAPNLILTPHVAASTREAQKQVSTEIAVQIVDFFAGRQVASPINPAVLKEPM